MDYPRCKEFGKTYLGTVDRWHLNRHIQIIFSKRVNRLSRQLKKQWTPLVNSVRERVWFCAQLT